MRTPARGSFAPQLGNAILDFRHRHDGDKQRGGAAISRRANDGTWESRSHSS
jgi:hypothetical protein